MTQTMTEPAPDPSPRPRRVERPREAPFKGVCTAVADATGTDAVLWRVLTVVLAFFGGVGIVLYVLGIVAIPRDDEERSIGDRLLHGPDRHLGRGQLWPVVILVVGLACLVTGTDGTLVLLVLGGLGVLWWRRREQHPTIVASDALAPDRIEEPALAWTPPPPRAERPGRPRSPLGGLTTSVAGLLAGALVLIGATTDTSISTEVVFGSALAVVGLGLVVGSWWGRSVGLVLLAVALAVALAVTAVVQPTVDAGLGERTWTPTGAASYRLGVGKATLDLTSLRTREKGTTRIDARVDVGHLIVLVPEGLRVTGTGTADLGEVVVAQPVGRVLEEGRDTRQDFVLGPAEGPQVQLALKVRLGQVEVRRA